jgi:uncharacterized protein (TIGR03118 family)
MDIRLRDLLGDLRSRHMHGAAQSVTFTQTNLVSDGSIPAAVTDPNLINPWGVSFSPTSPIWVSDDGTGVATLYNGAGVPQAAAGNFAITIATPPGDMNPATPTGQVFNLAAAGFVVSQNGVSAPATFLFATRDGTISGWNPTVNPKSSVIAVDNSASGNVYTGLAYATINGAPHIYAADAAHNKIDVFDSQFNMVNSFTDPSIPQGYSPYNVQALGGRLFVTYALPPGQDGGPGHGFVDEFDTSGNLITRVASGGPLDAPWGLDIAPLSAGPLAGDLLVGNFGDGTIAAYDLRTDMLAGLVKGADGKPLKIDGLWSLTNGNGFNGGDPNTIFFTAGPDNEQHGLFGTLTPSLVSSNNHTM